jgi:pSer/pThr/pTyr-binding forkhead associated (FHA) protein
VSSPPHDSSPAASFLLPPLGIVWSDLVGVLRSIPLDNFLAVKPAPFLLELPETDEARPLPPLPSSVGERRAFVQQRLKIIAQEDLREAQVHYLTRPSSDGSQTTGQGYRLTVGRKKGVNVQVKMSTVSKQHAELRLGPRGWTLVDLDAANGTSIEGRRIPAERPLPVTSGMVLEFSDYRAVFLAPEDIYQLLSTGDRVPVKVRDVMLPSPYGRRLRDVVEILADVDARDLATASTFLVQVPVEAEQEVLSEPIDPDARFELTQKISATRIMHLQRSRQVGDARVHVLTPSKRGITLGRDADLADVILDDPSVSKEHARIMFDKSWSIVDLETRNGTFLEKRRLEAGLRHPLRPGQGIYLSGYRALFLELDHLVQLVQKVQGKI